MPRDVETQENGHDWEWTKVAKFDNVVHKKERERESQDWETLRDAERLGTKKADKH